LRWSYAKPRSSVRQHKYWTDFRGILLSAFFCWTADTEDSPDRLEQQRPAGDRFAVVIGISETHEQIPPIEHQRDVPSEGSA